MNAPRRSRFDRSNSGPIGRWWWTVDRPLLVTLLILIGCGMVLVTAASPPVAARLGLDPFHFVYQQQIFLVIALIAMLGISLLETRQIRRLAVLGLLGSLFMLCLLPFVGMEVKGAIRWMPVPLIGTVQPSEFMKPCFAVVVAWVLSERYRNPGFPGYKISMVLFAIFGGLLIIQPDFGMMVTLLSIYGVELFLAGLPLFWVGVLGVTALCGVFGAYHLMPHVRHRIDDFLNPSADNYQVTKSLQAFQSGGLFGRGPGEGVVKWQIPDSHTDFIFAVAAEEFGVLLGIGLVALFAAVVLRSLWRVWHGTDMFPLLAVAGLVAQFGVQAIINMGVSLSLLPAKGMTLPFMSYGGSSLLAMALGMGMLLGLTRKRYGTLPQGRLHGFRQGVRT